MHSWARDACPAVAGPATKTKAASALTPLYRPRGASRHSRSADGHAPRVRIGFPGAGDDKAPEHSRFGALSSGCCGPPREVPAVVLGGPADEGDGEEEAPQGQEEVRGRKPEDEHGGCRGQHERPPGPRSELAHLGVAVVDVDVLAV